MVPVVCRSEVKREGDSGSECGTVPHYLLPLLLLHQSLFPFSKESAECGNASQHAHTYSHTYTKAHTVQEKGRDTNAEVHTHIYLQRHVLTHE